MSVCLEEGTAECREGGRRGSSFCKLRNNIIHANPIHQLSIFHIHLFIYWNKSYRVRFDGFQVKDFRQHMQKNTPISLQNDCFSSFLLRSITEISHSYSQSTVIHYNQPLNRWFKRVDIAVMTILQ